MALIQVTINDKPYEVESGQTILEACKKLGIHIPVLCHFEGFGNIGACRMCLVEIEGSPRLFPTCTTPIAAGQKIKTDSEKLKRYRRMTIELLFAERNHVCAVCVANNNCELQKLGYEVGMTRVRFPYLYQECVIDGSHEKFVADQNRCVLCQRCVRACSEVEGANCWEVSGRGVNARVINDFSQPWGEAASCTSCGKCVQVCPVGALWEKGSSTGSCTKKPSMVSELVQKKKVSV